MTSNIHFISAGAGSGKTYTLTGKLEQLLSSGAVTPAGVIATTFTKLAAGELKGRVRTRLIESGQPTVANKMEQSLIGTVNSVCGELVRRFAFEAGMPPEQQVVDDAQGNLLFYQALELALQDNRQLVRRMNATCHRLQITNRQNQLRWRSEVKDIVDAARANNQSAEDIRYQGKASADELLAHFPQTTTRRLDDGLLGAINRAIAAIDTEHDSTKVTREYISFITGIRAALAYRRLTWPEWMSLSKNQPGSRSKAFAEPIMDIAINYDKHPQLRQDIRFFAGQLFEIAAITLGAYQQLKAQKGLIDFVDQEQRLYQLLDKPAVIETLGQELQLLMVDEFQDTSPIQLALFLKLSSLADQVIWVGDIKQSIYGFRGSDPTLMTAVVKRVMAEGKPPQILESSWRSRPQLVAYVNELFTPAFANTLPPEQVKLDPAREYDSSDPAVELWRLSGRNKGLRAGALANAVKSLMASSRMIQDKDCKLERPLTYSDIAILCRTNANLDEIALALTAAKLPVRYKRPGLLSTPEGCLALACLRRLIDPLDTLATAEILCLTSCESPEVWLQDRLNYLDNDESKPYAWLEDNEDSPVASLKAQRSRLPYLTPVEALRAALDAGKVRQSVYRWGPTRQRSHHRLNNLSALINHAEDYVNQCATQNQPATAAGLVLWLQALAQAEEDAQAGGGDEAAIQLVTHHGAKGLEWPIVIAMDLDTDLRPKIWGLNVLPCAHEVTLDDPLKGRTLRYWPRFTGLQKSNIPLLDQIETGEAGLVAMAQEIEEAKRLLYVSLTRPRDGLVITMDNNKTGGPWMDTLDAEWMLPDGDLLTLPGGAIIPSRALEFEADPEGIKLPTYEPVWLASAVPTPDILPLRLSPSSAQPLESAKIGQVVELGERLPIDGEYDPARLGSAIHAVIATTLLGQNSTERVLREYGLENTLSAASADLCTERFLKLVEEKFSAVGYYTEYPVHYTLDSGQLISGWIDLLLETDKGYVLIDHKASPRTRSDWEEIALGYSGQLDTYARGVSRVSGKPVISQWIHFAVTGGLVEVVNA